MELQRLLWLYMRAAQSWNGRLCHSCTGEGGCRLLWRRFNLLSSAFYPLSPLLVPLVLTLSHASLEDLPPVAVVCCFNFPVFWVDVAVLQVALAHALFCLWAWFLVPGHLTTCCASAEIKLLGNFSSDDGDGSKSVTIKMN